MNREVNAYNCAIVRGGTSKGIFIMENELPKDQEKRDAIIRAIFGTPDVREIDGLGGADVLTSKLAIVGPSEREDADVDYTFGQVSFESEIIDYAANCGNISSAVGGFAIDHGMVPAVEPVTTVRIRMTNCDRILVAEVPVKDGKAQVDGDYQIDGVPGTGAMIKMDWSDTVGGVCGKLMPTGNAKDVFHIDGKDYEVSLIDMGNPLVFIKAEDLGMVGTETPDEIEANKGLMAEIEKIRGKAAKVFGLVENEREAAEKSPYAPFFAIISKPADYTGLNNKQVKKDDVDVVSRLLFMLRMHKAYPITGTVCTGAAAKIPGSVVYEAIPEENRKNTNVRIGHPGGVVVVEVEADEKDGQAEIQSVKITRTARTIMEGQVYVKKSRIGEA